MRPALLPVLAAAALAMPAAAQSPNGAAVVRLRPDTLERARAYQGRTSGPEQTERFSRKVRIGSDGRVSVSNISGNVVISAGSGDEVSIEAVKRARGGAGQLSNVRIDVEERGGAVYVRTTHSGMNDRVSVDYTITMPAAGTAEVHSVSGDVKVTGVRGAVRADTVSGNLTATDTPRLENAKSVSGDVTVSGVTNGGDLVAGSVSGNVTARSLKLRSLELSSVSGDLRAIDVTCDRLTAKSTSGGVEYTGAIARGGSYDINVHSGDVRLMLENPSGFVLNANTFSGSIRSDLPLTIGGDSGARDQPGRRRSFSNRSMRATYGDGSATLTVRTFSGDIVISKR
jgi:DUF4097 and DUF4098 domain-containing protein YvlB